MQVFVDKVQYMTTDFIFEKLPKNSTVYHGVISTERFTRADLMEFFRSFFISEGHFEIYDGKNIQRKVPWVV